MRTLRSEYQAHKELKETVEKANARQALSFKERLELSLELSPATETVFAASATNKGAK